MAEMNLKEGNVVLDTYIGNCHVKFCDDYVIKDEEEVKKQLEYIEQIIFNGLSKVP